MPEASAIRGATSPLAGGEEPALEGRSQLGPGHGLLQHADPSVEWLAPGVSHVGTAQHRQL